jgi:hypothetical protein
MASIFKPTYTKPIPAGAEIVTVKGEPHARWRRKGKTATAPLTQDGQRIVLESRKWYIEYRCQARPRLQRQRGNRATRGQTGAGGREKGSGPARPLRGAAQAAPG